MDRPGDAVRTALATLAAAVAVTIGGGALVAATGVLDIGASRGHPRIWDMILEFGMRRSVETNAPELEPPPLDDIDRIRLGAAHFDGGCAFCHSAPGQLASPVVVHMLPEPPDLAEEVPRWSDQELFFIVKHGLKYAGMPAWPGAGRDDEIWSVVAFLRVLPDLDGAAYRDLALGNVAPRVLEANELATRGPWSGARAACARCHEDDGAPPASALAPPLAGQTPEYLALALREYRAGRRESGVMETVAAELDDDQIEALAAFYAELPPHPAPGAAVPANPAAVARGEQIAQGGVPAAAVPPCLSCHGEGALPTYPRLTDLPPRYIEEQLRLWRDGVRGEDGQAALMAPIARPLTDQQIRDVAVFFAAGAAGADG